MSITPIPILFKFMLLWSSCLPSYHKNNQYSSPRFKSWTSPKWREMPTSWAKTCSLDTNLHCFFFMATSLPLKNHGKGKLITFEVANVLIYFWKERIDGLCQIAMRIDESYLKISIISSWVQMIWAWQDFCTIKSKKPTPAPASAPAPPPVKHRRLILFGRINSVWQSALVLVHCILYTTCWPLKYIERRDTKSWAFDI